MATGNDLLRVASKYVGYNRFDDPLPGTIFGRAFAELHGEEYAANGVPYCDMYVTKCLREIGITNFDSAYVPGRIATARARGWLVKREDALPGDLVCFDWDGDGVADHIGIAEIKYSWSYQTIEGNTSGSWRGSQSNGGGVYRRVRSFDSVIAVIRPPYTGASRPVVPAGTLAVDGWWGESTTRALQRINRTPQDGQVSSQYRPNREYFPAAGSGWEWTGENAEGSQLIIKLQLAFHVDADGIAGPEFVRGMQRYYRVTVDGYMGHATVRALQHAINRQLGRK